MPLMVWIRPAHHEAIGFSVPTPPRQRLGRRQEDKGGGGPAARAGQRPGLPCLAVGPA